MELTEDEKKLVGLALIQPVFRAWTQEPSTPYIVRQIYKRLLEKLKQPEKEKPILIVPPHYRKD